MLFLSVHVITGKPNSSHDTEEGEEDGKCANKRVARSKGPINKPLASTNSLLSVFCMIGVNKCSLQAQDKGSCAKMYVSYN